MNDVSKPVVDIIIPIFNAYPVINDCLDSVIQYFNSQARLILIDDCSSDSRIYPYLEQIKQKANFPVIIDRHQENQGFLKTANKGMRLSKEHDIILLNSDTIVSKNWISKLRNVAYQRSNIATVTPLSNNATIFSVPEFGKFNQLPEGYDVDSFAELIETISLKLYPEVPTGHGFCLYIKRTALNLLGYFDEIYGRGCEEENDFCMRVISYGLSNVMADDTFIYHAGKASYTDETRTHEESRNRQTLLQRYPFYLDLIDYYLNQRPVQIWDNINTNINKLKIGLDGRCLNHNISGTQRYLIELIKSYTHKQDSWDVSLLVSDGKKEYITQVLSSYQVNPQPKLIEESELETKVGSLGWDIFHITFQGISIEDFLLIKNYTKRVINTLQDFILSKNPNYFDNFNDFTRYNLHLNYILEGADGIIAISNYVKEQLLNKVMVEESRVKTIYHGINQENIQGDEFNYSIFNELNLNQKKYLLFIGNDFFHKNLESTVAVLKKTSEMGYQYQLVIVGNTMPQGGSTANVKDQLVKDKNIQDQVFFLNHISDENLATLYCNAGVLLYLSNSEGFGLLPLEAFVHDCPVIASSLTSIPEIVAEGATCFHPGEIDKIASEVVNLIEDPQQRDRAILKGRERVKAFDWQKTAAETIKFYYHILQLPPNPQHQVFSSYWQPQLEQTKTELTQAHSTITAMETSNFWKLREKWFKLKSWLGLANSEHE